MFYDVFAPGASENIVKHEVLGRSRAKDHVFYDLLGRSRAKNLVFYEGAGLWPATVGGIWGVLRPPAASWALRLSSCFEAGLRVFSLLLRRWCFSADIRSIL